MPRPKLKEIVTLARTNPRGLIPIIRFLAVGGLNTVFGYGLFAFLIWIKVQPELALLLSTIGGVSFNFLTYGNLAFSNRVSRKNLPRYIGVYGAFFVVNAALLRLLMGAGLSAYAVQILLFPFMATAMFYSLRTFVFAHR